MADPKSGAEPLVDATRHAIEVLRDGSRIPSASMLQTVANAVYLSNSQMAGEIGIALRTIMIIEGKRLPDAAVQSMNEALDEVERFWPDIRKQAMNL